MMAALELDQPLELEIDLLRLDGERRRVECVSGVIRDETGAVQRLIGAVHDVTEQRQASASRSCRISTH